VRGKAAREKEVGRGALPDVVDDPEKVGKTEMLFSKLQKWIVFSCFCSNVDFARIDVYGDSETGADWDQQLALAFLTYWLIFSKIISQIMIIFIPGKTC
jgi:hypothetical protein